LSLCMETGRFFIHYYKTETQKSTNFYAFICDRCTNFSPKRHKELKNHAKTMFIAKNNLQIVIDI
ncbi:MAG: hypothetical protein ACI4PQ_04555, partial [Butyricicoccaceae bacterium]